jgi:uncharacterized membrane protein YqiK
MGQWFIFGRAMVRMGALHAAIETVPLSARQKAEQRTAKRDGDAQERELQRIEDEERAEAEQARRDEEAVAQLRDEEADVDEEDEDGARFRVDETPRFVPWQPAEVARA